MLLIKDQEGDYSSNHLGRVVRLTSDRQDLLAEYLFGRNQATSFYNSAETRPDPQVYGMQPAYGDHRVTVDGSHAVNTGIIPQAGDDLTVMIFAAFPGGWPTTDNAKRHAVFGDQIGTSQIAFTTTGNSSPATTATIAGQITATDGTALTNTSAGTATLADPPSDFRALTFSVSGQTSPAMTIAEYKNGARLWQKPQVFSGKTRSYSGLQSMLIGSLRSAYPNGLVSNQWTVAAALIWRRALNSDDELNAYLEARTALAAMGIMA